MTEAPSLEETTPCIGASLPGDLKGTMDGKKPAMSQVEDIKHALEPYQKKYGHYLSKLKPWRDFFSLSKPDGDMRKRVEANLTYFQINYAVLFLILMIVSIVINPKCLIVILVLAVVWMAFLKKNDDPEWEVSIAGMPLGKSQRWMALGALTAIVLLSVVGQVIFSAAFVCAIFVVIHSVLHAVPEEVTTAANDMI
eukprot:CAMPEP_0169298222 /NCGR_PEP_ID=MMETSP1016-20121227/66306_1 /TAXON_ID=342587 /ORGANISM="Karlodinium micrum, Strain CCMP2283" /LENGTH=195 /DNA_ID=CAMNT_0009390161 /DNA_START=72 /DNA_END=659 /DNA_ORIENTATION=+